MRNYICTHRRKGVMLNEALHAFESVKIAAEYWGCPPKEVEVKLNESSIPPHHQKTEYRYRYSSEQEYTIDRVIHRGMEKLMKEGSKTYVG